MNGQNHWWICVSHRHSKVDILPCTEQKREYKSKQGDFPGGPAVKTLHFHTLLYLKWISDKDLLSTGNSAHLHVAAWMGGERGGEWVHEYVWLSTFTVYLELLQHSLQIGYVLCLIAQSCLTLCDPMDCSPPGSSVHGDSPGKNSGVGCHAPSRGSSQIRDRTQLPGIVGRFFTVWTTTPIQNKKF